MEKNEHILKIKLEKEWLNCLDKAFKEENKNAKIDGFRKGTAPKDIYLKKFGIESLYAKAVDEAINIGYRKLLKDNNLEPVVEPNVDVKEINEKLITLEFKIITKPEVVLGEYKKLGLEHKKCEVAPKEVDDELKRLQDQMADIIVKESGVIETGDTAVIDFKGVVDGKPLDGGSGENYSLEIGSNSFIPGFEEKLIGHKQGEKVTLNLKFPENYVENLKGKDVIFDVTINEVKTRSIPEINDDFYKDLGYENIHSENELREEIKKNLLANKEKVQEDEFIDKCLEEVAKRATIKINQELIDEEVKRMLNQYEQQLKMQGMDLNLFYQISHSTEKDLKDKMTPEAEKRVKYRYILEAIADKEKLTFTQEEVDVKSKEMADSYGITVEELIKAFGSIDIVKYDMKMHKALEIIKENN
jgi:trigger factor